MIGIEVIILEQSLKNLPSHGLNVKTVPNSLLPGKCSERDMKLY